MPNHVYNSISVEEKYAEKLAEIAKVGLCRYYKPMPDDLQGTTSPQRIPETISQQQYDILMEKYGCTDWYEWANREWGTKWGAYDNNSEDRLYTFTTAWSPPNDEILSMLMEDIPSFTFFWEEEQGYGMEFDVTNGKVTNVFEWDIAPWENVEDEDEITFLSEEYENYMGKFKKGYYQHYDLEGGYLGDTLEEAKDKLISFKS
jgi:hypothetical protein|tara:strand:- start:3974 stop:4582 length:609 start_codon:yes stop_codon:yes gene_type:complete